jgi:hypothetical protein
MTGFIGTSATISLNYSRYSAIANLHTFHFTVAHVLGFSVSTSRLVATDFNTEMITSNHYEVFFDPILQNWFSLSLSLKFAVRLESPAPNSKLLYADIFPFSWLNCHSRSRSYFTTGGLQPISSSWPQAPWDPRAEIFFFNWTLGGNSPYITSSLTRRWVCVLWICFVSRQLCVSHI